MGAVVDLAEARLAKKPHLHGQARCLACGNDWQAVAPIGTSTLECPACHLMQGAWFGHTDAGGHPVLTCACSNQLLFVAKHGAYCPQCGDCLPLP